MIVRNEERFLPQCLQSVQGVVDDIVIVDTGSTDRTLDIAREHNARVYEHPWEHSFAKARNQSLSYVHSDWVLILDADEELDKDAGPILREALSGNEYNAIAGTVISHHRGGMAKHTSIRAVRNLPTGVYWQRRVHNQVMFPGFAQFFPFTIYHHGYNLSPEEMKAKDLRTYKLLRASLRDEPDDPFTHGYLAVALQHLGHYKASIKHAKRAAKLWEQTTDGTGMVLNAWYTCANSYVGLGDIKGVERSVRKALKIWPDYADCWFLLGGCLADQPGREGDAVSALMRYMEANEKAIQSPSPGNVIQNCLRRGEDAIRTIGILQQRLAQAQVRQLSEGGCLETAPHVMPPADGGGAA
uniref:Putative glycosyltransferase n=1 Tax=viral metagenome TaxID=1070528 RepID=A0A6M3ILH9_9ZZZZ